MVHGVKSVTFIYKNICSGCDALTDVWKNLFSKKCNWKTLVC